MALKDALIGTLGSSKTTIFTVGAALRVTHTDIIIHNPTAAAITAKISIERGGTDVEIDKQEIPAGGSWDRVIQQQLKATDELKLNGQSCTYAVTRLEADA